MYRERVKRRTEIKLFYTLIIAGHNPANKEMSLSEEKNGRTSDDSGGLFFWFHEVVDLIIQVFDVYIQICQQFFHHTVQEEIVTSLICDKQIDNPFSVLDIRLVPWNSLYMVCLECHNAQNRGFKDTSYRFVSSASIMILMNIFVTKGIC